METFILEDRISENVCDEVIEYHKNNSDYKVQGATSKGTDLSVKDSVDVYFFNGIQHPAIKNYFKALQPVFEKYVTKYELINQLWLTTERANNIQYYRPGGGYKRYHFERGNLTTSRRQLTFMTYLNTVTDGGGTEFKYQNLKFSAEKGKTLIWPSDFTHTHKGEISPTQEKWIITGWFEYTEREV